MLQTIDFSMAIRGNSQFVCNICLNDLSNLVAIVFVKVVLTKALTFPIKMSISVSLGVL